MAPWMAGAVGRATRQQIQSRTGPVDSADVAASRAWASIAAVSHSASGSRPPLPVPRAPQAASQHDPGFLQQLVAAQKKVRAAWSSSDDERSDDEEALKHDNGGTDNHESLPDSEQGESSSLAAPAGGGTTSRAMHATGPAAPPAAQLIPPDRPCNGAAPQRLSTRGDDGGRGTDGGGAMPPRSTQQGGPPAQRACSQGAPDAARKRKMPQAIEVPALACSPDGCTILRVTLPDAFKNTQTKSCDF